MTRKFLTPSPSKYILWAFAFIMLLNTKNMILKNVFTRVGVAICFWGRGSRGGVGCRNKRILLVFIPWFFFAVVYTLGHDLSWKTMARSNSPTENGIIWYHRIFKLFYSISHILIVCQPILLMQMMNTNLDEEKFGFVEQMWCVFSVELRNYLFPQLQLVVVTCANNILPFNAGKKHRSLFLFYNFHVLEAVEQ